jgi:hypothetical protein
LEKIDMDVLKIALFGAFVVVMPAQATPHFETGMQANGGLLIVANNTEDENFNCSVRWTVVGQEFGVPTPHEQYDRFSIPAKRVNVKVMAGGGIDVTAPRLTEGPDISCSGSGAARPAEISQRKEEKKREQPGGDPADEELYIPPPPPPLPPPALPLTRTPANRGPGVLVPNLPLVLPGADGKIQISTNVASCNSSWDGSCSTQLQLLASAPAGWSFCKTDAVMTESINGSITEKIIDSERVFAWGEARGNSNPLDRVGGSVRVELGETMLIPAMSTQEARDAAGCTVPPAKSPPPSNCEPNQVCIR